MLIFQHRHVQCRLRKKLILWSSFCYISLAINLMMRCSWRVQTSARGSTLVLRAVPNVNLRSLKQKQRASYRCRLVSVTLLNQIVLIFDLETQPTLTQVTSPQGKSTNLATLPLEPLKALNEEAPADMMLLTLQQCK